MLHVLFLFYLHNRVLTRAASPGFLWHVSCEVSLTRQGTWCAGHLVRSATFALTLNKEVVIMGKRTEYAERLSAHMVEWDTQIDLVRDRAESTAPETKTEHSDAIAALQFKRDEFSVKLQGIWSATDDDWEDLKTGTEHVLSEVRTMFHAAVTTIR